MHDKNFCADLADRKRCIFRSRRRTGTCELSARLFCRKPLSCAMVTGSSALAAAYEGSLSVTNVEGTMRYLRISLCINRSDTGQRMAEGDDTGPGSPGDNNGLSAA